MAESERLDELTNNLRDQGWGFFSDLLPTELFTELSTEALALYESDEFRRARIGPTDEELLRPDVRRDFIFWLKPEEFSETQLKLSTVVTKLMHSLSQRLFLSLRTFEAHFAVYPGGGFYSKHLDQFQSDCLRQISFVIYLNHDWQESDGGELRIYNENDPEQIETEIQPRFGTAVMFLSSSIYHEVLPTTNRRVSLAGWMRKEVIAGSA